MDRLTKRPHVIGFCSPVQQLYIFKPHCLDIAVFHAAVIIKFITISTGTKSAITFSLHIMVLKSPFPTADTIPVGPFQLSTQPTNGSFKLERTEKVKKDVPIR